MKKNCAGHVKNTPIQMNDETHSHTRSPFVGRLDKRLRMNGCIQNRLAKNFFLLNV